MAGARGASSRRDARSAVQAAPARRAALGLLGEQRRRAGRMRDLLRESSALGAMDERERSLVTRLALGVISTRGTVDACIDTHVRVGTHLEPRLRDTLRLSAYELLFLSTPPAVAVSQGVELARSVAPRASGLANAILRRVAEKDVARMAQARARMLDPAAVREDDLALVGGLPTWLVSELVRSRGLDAARALVGSLADPAPVYVAAHAMRHGDDAARALLDEAGLDPRSTDVPAAFELGAPAGLAPSGLVQRVDVVPADLSAQAIAQLVTPLHDASLLEVGQGRATKTLLTQFCAHRRGITLMDTAVELEPFKARLAAERVARAGCDETCHTIVFDGCRLAGPAVPAELDRRFDVVFVDAPCSGVGTLRRHPEVAWSLSRGALDGDRPDALPSLQLRLLSAASSRVAVGGTLAYSTCSPLVQEDERVVSAFLSSDAGRGFERAPMPLLDGVQGAATRGAAAGDGSLCFVQRRGGPDAHYLSLLVRTA